MGKLIGYMLTGFGLLGLAVEADGLMTGTSKDLALGLVLSGLFIASGIALVRSARRKDEVIEAVREKHGDQLEASILRLAKDKGGRLGVVEVAASLGTPLEDSEACLRRLMARGACEELVTDAGVSIFRFAELELAGASEAKRDLLEPGDA